MRKFSILFLIISLWSLSAFSQEKMQMQEKKEMKEMKTTKESKSMSPTYTGYLVDKMCATGYVKSGDAAKAAEKGMKHSKACALDEDCAASGFGIISDGKYLKFDEAGDKMAFDYLNKSDKKSDFKVEVSGTAEGNMITVKTLTDAKMEMKKEETKKEGMKQEMKKY